MPNTTFIMNPITEGANSRRITVPIIEAVLKVSRSYECSDNHSSRQGYKAKE
jgi:hypothetical protein